jgi:ribosomal-protein-alanine N-acetyltransferase
VYLVDTGRLLLRPFSTDDAPDLLRLFGDREVMRYWSSAPLADLDEAREAGEHIAGMQRRHGFAQWHVSEQPGARFVGAVGLQPLEKGEVELIGALLPAGHGKGFATEAARAALAYGFDEAGLMEIVAIARAANLPSLRVMQRLGMERVGPAVNFGLDWEKYVPGGQVWRLSRA